MNDKRDFGAASGDFEDASMACKHGFGITLQHKATSFAIALSKLWVLKLCYGHLKLLSSGSLEPVLRIPNPTFQSHPCHVVFHKSALAD